MRHDTEATSANTNWIKQTEAGEETLSYTNSCSKTNTCYTAVNSSTSQSELKESFPKKSNSTTVTRNIPITIELDDHKVKSDIQETPVTAQKETIKFPVTISKCQGTVESDCEKEATKMPSIRTIPIQRVNGSPSPTVPLSPSMEGFPTPFFPKSPSKDSLTSPQRIKMGTSAIRIPIQIQRSVSADTNDPPENVDTKNDKTLPVNASKPPQSVRNVPILRQSLSDSGVGKNMSSKQHSRSRNTSAQSNTEDKLQKVHEELEVNT